MVIMDTRRLAVVLAVVVMAVVQLGCGGGVSGKFVFEVENKFKVSGRERKLSALRAHDAQHHRRLLSSVVGFPLGGNGLPTSTGLYFTKIGLGTPSKDYYVQVDTGSDILWVNCADCRRCPSKSDLGIKLTLFDPQKSKTSSEVGCGDAFCTPTYGQLPGCKPGLHCVYGVTYGDGSATSGYFVKDTIQLNQATANAKTSPLNASIIFGCGNRQTGDLASSTEAAVDGILGFGQANSSILSQLAAAGKVKKEFAHCLDVVKGGGIFAVGDVVRPVVKTTPLVANKPHYNVQMKAVEVGGSVLNIPTYVFDSGDQKETIIDSGTTLAYLPQVVYEPMMKKILAWQPGLKLQDVEEQFYCFVSEKNIDNAFPNVTFHFEGSLTLTVYPHDYLFKEENGWCFGWQNTGQKSPDDGSNMIILGDMVLSNKLVVYDIQNQTIGWTEYNCTSSITMKDEQSGSTYTIGADYISSALSLKVGMLLLLSLLSLTIGNVYTFGAHILSPEGYF